MSAPPGATPGVHRDAASEQTADTPRRLSPAARMLRRAVVAYRRWISPAMPARCRFYPSCSAYALEAVTRHGAVRGTALALWRLLRCHPFHPGGYDPVPGRPAIVSPTQLER